MRSGGIKQMFGKLVNPQQLLLVLGCDNGAPACQKPAECLDTSLVCSPLDQEAIQRGLLSLREGFLEWLTQLQALPKKAFSTHSAELFDFVKKALEDLARKQTVTSTAFVKAELAKFIALFLHCGHPVAKKYLIDFEKSRFQKLHIKIPKFLGTAKEYFEGSRDFYFTVEPQVNERPKNTRFQAISTELRNQFAVLDRVALQKESWGHFPALVHQLTGKHEFGSFTFPVEAGHCPEEIFTEWLDTCFNKKAVDLLKFGLHLAGAIVGSSCKSAPLEYTPQNRSHLRIICGMLQTYVFKEDSADDPDCLFATVEFGIAEYVGRVSHENIPDLSFGAGGSWFPDFQANLRLKRVKFLEVNPLTEFRGLRTVFLVAGFMSQVDDFSKKWSALIQTQLNTSFYSVRWPADTNMFLKFCPIALAGRFWRVQKKAKRTGILLAHLIEQQFIKCRVPITLVGFSLGTQVILSCLQELAKLGVSVVEDVVLLGAAAPNEEIAIIEAKQAISGRFINVFSQNDQVLSVLYRSVSFTRALGIGPTNVCGVEDVDLSAQILDHHDYKPQLGLISERIGF